MLEWLAVYLVLELALFLAHFYKIIIKANIFLSLHDYITARLPESDFHMFDLIYQFSFTPFFIGSLDFLCS